MQRRDSKQLLIEAVDLRGKRVIDVGCGEGELARFLACSAGEVVGVECNAALRERAAAGPSPATLEFREGVGEALPCADESADVIVYSNSLHHVPAESQAKALEEAARVLRRGGDLLVLEPVARGAFQRVLAPVHDETLVRARAQRELAAAVSSGRFEQRARFEFPKPVTFASFEALRARVLSINPDKRAAIEADAIAWRARFEREGIKRGDGWLFEQPHVFAHLRRR